jgi:hypothetical protein
MTQALYAHMNSKTILKRDVGHIIQLELSVCHQGHVANTVNASSASPPPPPPLIHLLVEYSTFLIWGNLNETGSKHFLLSFRLCGFP